MYYILQLNYSISKWLKKEEAVKQFTMNIDQAGSRTVYATLPAAWRRRTAVGRNDGHLLLPNSHGALHPRRHRPRRRRSLQPLCRVGLAAACLRGRAWFPCRTRCIRRLWGLSVDWGLLVLDRRLWGLSVDWGLLMLDRRLWGLSVDWVLLVLDRRLWGLSVDWVLLVLDRRSFF